MTYNTEQILKIFEKEDTITQTAKKYCSLNGFEYTDSVRRRISKIINSEKTDEDLDVETKTATNQYSNDREETKVFMPSAWDEDKNRFLDIDEYCDKYGLPKEQVRSSKLVAHLNNHMIYNIAFEQSISEKTGIDEEFIESVVKKHVSPVEVNSVELGDKKWVDRVIYTDAHIGMDTTGGKNVEALYDDEWNKNVLFDRLDEMISTVKEFKRGDELIIDELGDFLDGLGGKTTRKGHDLPQNMSDKEVFEAGIEFKVKLIDELVRYYSKITLNNITEDNHSGVMGYFVNSTVKKIVEYKYENVKYNLLEKFINHYSVGEHTFVLSHGKDSEALKFGFKPVLDTKQIEKIDQYLKEYNLYNNKRVEFSKGDSHQCIFDFTTSNDFEYLNYPAFSPPSNWVKTNFKNSKSGFVIEHLDLNSKVKLINPFWFDK